MGRGGGLRSLVHSSQEARAAPGYGNIFLWGHQPSGLEAKALSGLGELDRAPGA